MYEYESHSLTETQKVVLALGLIIPFGLGLIITLMIIVSSAHGCDNCKQEEHKNENVSARSQSPARVVVSPLNAKVHTPLIECDKAGDL